MQVNLNGKKFQKSPSFQNCIKGLWYWFVISFPMSGLQYPWSQSFHQNFKKVPKKLRTLVWPGISSTSCHGDICPSNIYPGNICPYQEYSLLLTMTQLSKGTLHLWTHPTFPKPTYILGYPHILTFFITNHDADILRDPTPSYPPYISQVILCFLCHLTLWIIHSFQYFQLLTMTLRDPTPPNQPDISQAILHFGFLVDLST